MIRLQIIICSLIIYSSVCFGQIECLQDSVEIRKFFPEKHGNKRWKFIIGLDAKRSFYAGKPVKFNGIRVGTEFKGVHRFGIGIYGLNKNIEFHDIDVQQPGTSDEPAVKFNVTYSSLFYERVFYKIKRWEIALPVSVSGGKVEGIYQDTSGQWLNMLEKPFSALNFGVRVKFYIWKWLAPTSLIGYRYTFNADSQIKQAFNSPYYSFGISIGIGDLYDALFKKDTPRKKIKQIVKEGKVDE